jgi:uncharacterized membrane protein
VTDAPTLVWTWVPTVPAWAAVVIAAFAAVAVLTALISLPSVGWPRRALAVTLRTVAMVPLALALAGLSRSEVESETVRRPLVVLLDRSASMAVREDGVSRIQQVVVGITDQSESLAGAADSVQLWAMDGEVQRVALSHLDVEPRGLETDYLGAIEQVLDGARPAAIVLFGDGADRSTLGAAWRSGHAGALANPLGGVPVPVHVVPVGGELARDLSITIGSHAPFAFVRRPIELEARVTGGEDGPVTVELVRDGETTATRTVELHDGGADVSFRVVPEHTGSLTLGVRVPTPVADPLPNNNADERTWRVIRDRTRVLHLTSHPSWDVRFLRRLFETDPNVDLVSFYVMRTGPLQGQFRSSPISLIEFPHEELFTEDLPGFDLLVLHNFTLGSLPSALFAADRYMESVNTFVREGGAVLLVGGDRAFEPLESRGMEPLIPLPPLAAEAEVGGPASFSPTEAGRRHPVLRVDRAAVVPRWEELPSVQSYNRLSPPAEGAVVLATAGEGGDPLLAVRSVGAGRVMQLATDASWTWALADGDGGLHAEFWRNSIRWLVRDEAEALLEVGTDRPTYDLGERVRVRVSLFDEDYAPASGRPVTVRVGPLAGEATELSGITDEGGSWSDAIQPTTPGTWSLEATAADGLRSASSRFSVRADPAELRDPTATPELLEAIAAATGGEVLQPGSDLVALARESHVERRVSRVVHAPAWTHWGWLLAAALPLGLEWWLRRRWSRA